MWRGTDKRLCIPAVSSATILKGFGVANKCPFWPIVLCIFLLAPCVCVCVCRAHTHTHNYGVVHGVPETSAANWRVSAMAQSNENLVYKHRSGNASVTGDV
jgi:hypothetical protein